MRARCIYMVPILLPGIAEPLDQQQHALLLLVQRMTYDLPTLQLRGGLLSVSYLQNTLRSRQSSAVGNNLGRPFDTASESLGCLATLTRGTTSGDGSAALEHLEWNVLIGGHASSRQRWTIV